MLDAEEQHRGQCRRHHVDPSLADSSREWQKYTKRDEKTRKTIATPRDAQHLGATLNEFEVHVRERININATQA
jgi:hypothetical protein